MKPQYEFKKFPILATVLAAACLLFAVIGVTSSLFNYDYFYGGPVFTGLLLVIVSVLAIAGLTTGRPLLLKVISIIISISVITTNFIVTIVEYNNHKAVLFGVILLALIASVLAFVYFLTVKTERIRKMYLVTGSVLSVLVLAYAITFTIKDLTRVLGQYDAYEYPYYFILVGYAIVTSLPMVVYFSLSKKEEPKEEQPKEEPQQEEVPAEESKQIEEQPAEENK